VSSSRSIRSFSRPRPPTGAALVAACVAAFAGALASACTVGAPPGFSGGDHWVFPLVDPLEDGLLVTPVTINGAGPYLFAIDPDANVSAIDMQVVAEAKLRNGQGPHRIDEGGSQQIRAYAELLDFQIGSLTIDRRPAMMIPVGLYDSRGRHVSGVIGRDVLADSLVFGFDRDQGIAMLTTTKAFRPPPSSVDIKYQAVSSRMLSVEVPPVPRRLASATINGAAFSLHLDLGAKASQLRESRWVRAGLSPVPARFVLVDEAGTARTVTQAATAGSVVLGSATRNAARSDVVFVPYQDRRWETEGVDGTLGLSFFAGFSVWTHWDRATYHLVARGDVMAQAAARLARWGNALPSCPHPGCITAAIDRRNQIAGDPDGSPGEVGGKAPRGIEPGSNEAEITITIARDAEAVGRALQVVLAPAPVAGKPAPGWLIANLPAGVGKLDHPLGPEYAGVTLQVVDVSPFPRACPDPAAGCVAPFAPAEQDAAPAPAGPAPPPVPTVIPDKLRRLTGEATIAPGDAAQQAIAAAGTPPAVAIVRVCLTPEGTIESIRMVKSTKITAYDEQLVNTIKATWTFEPFAIDGKPSAVCAPFTFKSPAP
jgi:hypothetical protein